ncbi:hypothetical protein JHK87_033765 [Glycine soja]|nr:hypothetical protein JHK87_033765 [Glycine soja]
MAFTSTLTTLTTLVCLYMFYVNATTHKEIPQMGQSLGTSDTILSCGGNFELGFFSRDYSTKYYVGIWYKRVPNDKIVYVSPLYLLFTMLYSVPWVSLGNSCSLQLFFNISATRVWFGKLVVTARSVWGAHFALQLDSSHGLTAR